MNGVPCRYCLQDAHESICLNCRSKFEHLERENAFLKGQIAILRSQAAGRYRQQRVEISRACKPRGK